MKDYLIQTPPLVPSGVNYSAPNGKWKLHSPVTQAGWAVCSHAGAGLTLVEGESPGH